jgi:hypothetical protein
VPPILPALFGAGCALFAGWLLTPPLRRPTMDWAPMLLGAALCLLARLIATCLAQAMASEGGQTRGAALIADVLDRLAEIVLLFAVGVTSLNAMSLAFLAIPLMLLTDYVGALGAPFGAAGLELGPMGTPHRTAVLGLGCAIAAAQLFAGRLPAALEICLLVIVIGSIATIVRRVLRVVWAPNPAAAEVRS